MNINDVIKDQSINLTDVAFTYPSRPNFPILENFNLDVPSGSVTAIVGKCISRLKRNTKVSFSRQFFKEIFLNQILILGTAKVKRDRR